MSPAFRWYLGGVGCWFAGYGMASILMPWLVAVVLHESPSRLGVAQLALMGPWTVFLLFGGAIADRADCRALLMRYHALAVLPPLALGVTLLGGAISYPMALGYGLAIGTLSAFIMPARDSLLTRVVTSGVPRAIALATAVQYGFQLAGIALAGTAERVGVVPLLLVQATLLGLGALTTWRLPPTGASGPRPRESRLAAIRDGLRAVVRSGEILPVVLAIAAVGVLYVGAFVVVIPLMVRDLYGGGAAELALLNFCFWGGTVGVTIAQVRLITIERPGRAILVSLTVGAGILAAMGLPITFAMLAGLCAAWGIGAGITMTQTRTIAQLAAPPTHRARVLAVFQLGLLGGSAIGALLIGQVVALVGPRLAVLYPAAAMLVVLVWLITRSGLWGQAALAPAEA